VHAIFTVNTIFDCVFSDIDTIEIVSESELEEATDNSITRRRVYKYRVSI